jgi:translocation and assembly module TamB
MRIQLDGSLDVRKAADDSIRVFGTITVVPERSHFEQFGRRFTLSSGTVTFNGPMMAWVANFQARYPVPSREDPSAPQVVITLAVRGGLDDLNLTLGAEPAMETADVLSYLATGRPAASAVSFERSIGGYGAHFAAGQLSGALEESAAEHVGLDVIEIRHNGIKGATVVAGRYVTSRLFVGFEQPLTLRDEDDDEGGRADQSAEVKLEYSAYRWLVLHLQQGQSRFQFFLRFRRSF